MIKFIVFDVLNQTKNQKLLSAKINEKALRMTINFFITIVWFLSCKMRILDGKARIENQ